MTTHIDCEIIYTDDETFLNDVRRVIWQHTLYFIKAKWCDWPLALKPTEMVEKATRKVFDIARQEIDGRYGYRYILTIPFPWIL